MDSSFNSPGAGYLGSTSFSAVFSEDRRISDPGSPFRNDGFDGETVISQTIRPGRIEQGAEVLEALTHTPRYAQLVQEWHNEVCGLSLFSPWVEACTKTVQVEVYDHIARPREDSEKTVLLRLSERIFRNNLQPLRFDGSCTLDQFTALFNGPNVRWETIGIFLTGVGLAATETSSRELVLGGGPDGRRRNALARRMLDLGQTCIRFCSEFGHVTDPKLWLLGDHGRFTSIIGTYLNITLLRRTFQSATIKDPPLASLCTLQ